MKLFFSVGEPSGDLHGANLIGALRARAPEIECVGYGGPRMAAAGLRLEYDLTQLAVMWFAQAIRNLGLFWRLVVRADRIFRHQRPDAVILIDYPGFNWWIARRAKAHGIPVFYYGVPQMWAWAPWRVKKMRRLVDHVLCKLPFEAEWYESRGCAAHYVGHPYFDELASRKLDVDFLRTVQSQESDSPRPLITLLPGSRTQEVRLNLQAFLRTAERVRHLLPETRFAIAAFRAEHAQYAEQILAADHPQLPVAVHVGRTPELIAAAQACLACSGSVSLELMYHEKPSVVHYQVSRSAFFVQRFFRRVRFITLVNLLASDRRYCTRGELYDPHVDQVPFPEYLTCTDMSETMAGHLVTWLTDARAYHGVCDELRRLKQAHAQPGASQRAAESVLARLDVPAPPRAQRTHYRPDAA